MVGAATERIEENVGGLNLAGSLPPTFHDHGSEDPLESLDQRGLERPVATCRAPRPGWATTTTRRQAGDACVG